MTRRSWLGVLTLGGMLAACGGGSGGNNGNGDGGTKGSVNDPLFAKQWHLENTGQDGATAGADIKARLAWGQGVSGKGVTIAVVDDGIDTNHEDFRGKLRIVQNSDPSGGDSDPNARPVFEDFHGTATNGLAAANGNNSIGVAGVAYGATLMPFRWLSDQSNLPISSVADVFRRAVDNGADVISNSWGPAELPFPLPDVMRSAIDYANASGRGGRGTTILFSSGNDTALITGNGLASYAGVIAVGASTDQDLVADFSTSGPELDVLAPGDGVATSGIWSTDLTGLNGYSAGQIQPGTYVAGVATVTGQPTYSLSISGGGAQVAEKEPNNFLRQAQDVPSPSTIDGTADAPRASGDVRLQVGPFTETFTDLYRFTITAGQTGGVRLHSNQSTGVDIDLAIADTAGHILGVSLGTSGNEAFAQSGDTSGNYEDNFAGTSAACPIAAGVVALMLEAKPTLTSQDVQRILKASADKIVGPYDSNGHNDHYGSGRVNAGAAVKQAKAATASANKATASRSFAAWPRAQKPAAGGLYWYSAGQAHELRLDRGASYVRDLAEAPVLRRLARRKPAPEDPAWLLGARRTAISEATALRMADGARQRGERLEVAPALSTRAGLPLWLGRTLVVGLPEGADLKSIADLLAAYGLEVDHAIGSGDYVLRSPQAGLATLEAANALYESGRVLYAHPDFVVPMKGN
jgi:subtilisin family serine protease